MKNYQTNNYNENNNGEKQHVRDMLKKGMAAAFAALLIGSIAAGSLVSAEETVKKNDNERVTLLKTAEDAEETGKAEVDGDKYDRTIGYLDVSNIVDQAMPSVVSITTTSVEEMMDYFSMFGYGGYAPQEREVEGRGSGVIIGKNDDELLIVTNFHVIEGANTISVGFVNNTAVEGKVKGYDESKDLAVVAVAKEDLDADTLSEISIANVGSSDDIKVGEQVVAIGNAMGYGQSVTTGIVSAKTSFSEQDDYYYSDDNGFGNVNLIQTDAAINPGNSGGALLNMDGELIGINCAKLASTEVEGMGYAIAISDVDDEVIEDLMNEEYREKLGDTEHGIIGITGATVSQEEAKKYGFPQGVYVSEVTEGGAADEAGIKAGDFIIKFRNKSLASINELIDYLNYYEPGEEVDLTIIRDGEEMVISVKLQEQTEEYKKSHGYKEDADVPDEKDDQDDRRGDDREDGNENYDEWDFDDFWNNWGGDLFR